MKSILFTLLFLFVSNCWASVVHVDSFPYKEPTIKYHNDVTEILFPADHKYQPAVVTLSSEDLISKYEIKYRGIEQEYFVNTTSVMLFLPLTKSAIHIEVTTVPSPSAPVPVPSAIFLLGTAVGALFIVSRRNGV